MTTVDASAPTVDFSFDQGDSEPFNIERQHDDGTARNISGYTFWLTIKRSKTDTDADAALQKTVSSHAAPSQGKTTIPLTSSDTASLSGVYYFDIQEKTDTDDINTLVTGNVYFAPDVTEATS